jgi:hypothetical protein
LIVSVNDGLFGFKESLSAPSAVESIVLEIVAVAALVARIALDLMMESPQGQRAAHADTPARTTVRLRTID